MCQLHWGRWVWGLNRSKSQGGKGRETKELFTLLWFSPKMFKLHGTFHQKTVMIFLSTSSFVNLSVHCNVSSRFISTLVWSHLIL